jgi:hypothetical protein
VWTPESSNGLGSFGGACQVCALAHGQFKAKVRDVSESQGDFISDDFQVGFALEGNVTRLFESHTNTYHLAHGLYITSPPTPLAQAKHHHEKQVHIEKNTLELQALYFILVKLRENHPTTRCEAYLTLPSPHPHRLLLHRRSPKTQGPPC